MNWLWNWQRMHLTFDDYNCEFALHITVLMGTISKDFTLTFGVHIFPSFFLLFKSLCTNLRSDFCCMIFDDLPGKQYNMMFQVLYPKIFNLFARFHSQRFVKLSNWMALNIKLNNKVYFIKINFNKINKLQTVINNNNMRH